jgi:hemerythrin-like domain-containing protein
MTDQMTPTRTPAEAPSAPTNWTAPPGFVPADTRIMGIVHRALRRDLERTRTALRQPIPPHDEQRRAIAEHVVWMMEFLHRHHENEDAGLYPVIRARSSEATALLDDMAADHRRVAVALEALSGAARRYGDDPDAAEALFDAVVELESILLPHLDREEADAMPLAAAHFSKSEWEQWDEEMNVGPLPKSELAKEGLWFLDGLGPDDAKVVTDLVPPVPRWFILNIVSRGERRATFRRWRLPEHTDLRVPLAGTTVVDVAATPQQVWDVLSDVSRVGEWSHECRRAEWLDGARSVAVGARFRGGNRSGSMKWSRPCTIEVADAPHTLAWVTDGGVYGDNSAWRFSLTPHGDGTRIEQSFRVLNLPVWFDRFIWRMIPAHHDRTAALHADLEQLGRIAAAG